jgi:hypothetical protein
MPKAKALINGITSTAKLWQNPAFDCRHNFIKMWF